MAIYQANLLKAQELTQSQGATWQSISPEYVARMRAQNQFKTGLEIARYTANIMRRDMKSYDLDHSAYTQSLGCWHGFTAQQMLLSIKKHHGTTDKRYIYLSGWMIAALRSEFGPLPDQSMHEKTAVPNLIEEIYTFLKQSDSRELSHLFRDLDKAKSVNDELSIQRTQLAIDDYQTNIVPIIADIDAGFGNEEATYLLAKKMIEAGACCIQIENQVSDAKQCGHQDGKVTVPHEDFLAKINAVRYAFLELGVDQGIIVARTDSLGAGLTQKIPVSKEPGDLADQYNSFLELERLDSISDAENCDVLIKRDKTLYKLKRLANGLFQFRKDTGAQRAVLDCIASLKHGADLLWIETEKPHIGQIKSMVDEIRKAVPNAKLVYNNSPSFNWTLNFRQQVFDDWFSEGKVVSRYDRGSLMKSEYDESDIAKEADARILNFQRQASSEAGIFHHLITLPTYHDTALATDRLAENYFGDKGMLAYVQGVQRQEIRRGMDCVKHQDMSGSNIGDDHKGYFSGEHALKASGEANTMNQFN